MKRKWWLNDKERFLLNSVQQPNGCWVWSGTCQRDGYGSLSINSKPVRAHIFSYKTFVGEVTKDLCVLHTCDNPLCVNPDHLWLGTRAENNADRAAKKRSADSKGEKHNQAKLTADQVAAIRKDSRQQKTIAQQYGVSQSCISRIKSNNVWSHLGE